LRNNPIACGQVRTRVIDGACVAVDPQGRPLPEAVRLRQLLKETAR
jgi:hypothetical protein